MDCEDAVAAVIAETDRDILRIEERQECMKGGQSACVCDSWAAKKRAKDCLQARCVWCCDAGVYMAFCFCFRRLDESISFISLRKTASGGRGAIYSVIPRRQLSVIIRVAERGGHVHWWCDVGLGV